MPRAGIPARIVFGSRLKPENAGKDVDPGYRCWVYVFAPRIGWFPVECAAGGTVEGKKEYYFGNLDDRRVCWIEGRNRVLVPPQDRAGCQLYLARGVRRGRREAPRGVQTST